MCLNNCGKKMCWMAKAFSTRVEGGPAVDKRWYWWDTTPWVGWQYGVGMIPLLLFSFCFHSGRFDCLFYPLAICSLFSLCFSYVLFCFVFMNPYASFLFFRCLKIGQPWFSRLKSVSDPLLIICDVCLQPWRLLCPSTFKASGISLCLYFWRPLLQYSVDKNGEGILMEHGAIWKFILRKIYTS